MGKGSSWLRILRTCDGVMGRGLEVCCCVVEVEGFVVSIGASFKGGCKSVPMLTQ